MRIPLRAVVVLLTLFSISLVFAEDTVPPGMPIAKTAAEVRDRLSQRVTLAVDENFTYAELIELLEKRFGIGILLDPKGVEPLGISGISVIVAEPVSLHDVRLAFFLHAILDENDLTYVLKGNVLLITSTEQAQEYLDVRVYNVADLVLETKTVRDGEKITLVPDPELFKAVDFSELLDLIDATVSPESWEDDADMMECYETLSIAIRQTERGHEELEKLFQFLREGRKEQNRRGLFNDPPVIRDSEISTILEIMAKPATFSLDENTTCEELFAMISKEFGLQFLLEAKGTQPIGLTSASTVVADSRRFKDVPLGDALRLVLAENGLTWLVRENVVFVSGDEHAQYCMELRAYCLADLVVPNKIVTQDGKLLTVPDEEAVSAASFTEIMDLIEAVVAPESWDRDAEMMEHYPTLTLVVRQTCEVHEELETLLKSLRAKRQESVLSEE